MKKLAASIVMVILVLSVITLALFQPDPPAAPPEAATKAVVEPVHLFSMNGVEMTEEEFRIQGPIYLAEKNGPREVYLVVDLLGDVHPVSKEMYDALDTMDKAELERWYEWLILQPAIRVEVIK